MSLKLKSGTFTVYLQGRSKSVSIPMENYRFRYILPILHYFKQTDFYVSFKLGCCKCYFSFKNISAFDFAKDKVFFLKPYFKFLDEVILYFGLRLS